MNRKPYVLIFEVEKDHWEWRVFAADGRCIVKSDHRFSSYETANASAHRFVTAVRAA